MKTMKDFYAFESKGYLTTFSATPKIFRDAISFERRDEAGKIMDDLIRGYYNDYNFPIEMNPGELGAKLRDILDTRYPPAYLISDRMKNLLEENQITGWKTYPIELYDRKKNLILGYNGFSFTGKAGPMDLRNQPVIEKPTGVSQNLVKYYHGGYFDINTWDGSDFFMLESSYWVIVTQRTMELLKRHKISAMEFRHISEMDLMYSTFNK